MYYSGDLYKPIITIN